MCLLLALVVSKLPEMTRPVIKINNTMRDHLQISLLKYQANFSEFSDEIRENRG